MGLEERKDDEEKKFVLDNSNNVAVNGFSVSYGGPIPDFSDIKDLEKQKFVLDNSGNVAVRLYISNGGAGGCEWTMNGTRIYPNLAATNVVVGSTGSTSYKFKVVGTSDFTAAAYFDSYIYTNNIGSNGTGFTNYNTWNNFYDNRYVVFSGGLNNANVSVDYGTPFYAGYAQIGTYTLLSADGFQYMAGDAMAWEEMTFPLLPYAEQLYGGMTTPEVLYGFGDPEMNKGDLPYFNWSANLESTEWIPFQFEIPHDYAEGTDMWFNIHFSVPPQLFQQVNGYVEFLIEYYIANPRQDCRDEIIPFSHQQLSGITSCVCESLSNEWTHEKTPFQYNCLIPASELMLKHSAIIRGKVARDSRIIERKLECGVAALSIDIHYQTASLGTHNDNKDGGDSL